VPGIPAYAYPESAARALGHAARYHAWRTRQHGRVPELPGVRADAARAQVSAFLAAAPAGGWLSPAEVGDLLTCYQIAPPQPAPAGQARADGVEVFAGVRQEAVFGPVVVLGLSGIAGEAVGDCTARLTPLTDTDAADMIHEGPAAPVLARPQGRPAADTGALAGMLLRVSRLAEDLPEVAELDLNPVIASPDGARAVAARIRLSPSQPQDPFLRRLR
jgi:ATP-grasp domain